MKNAYAQIAKKGCSEKSPSGVAERQFKQAIKRDHNQRHNPPDQRFEKRMVEAKQLYHFVTTSPALAQAATI